MKHDAFASHRTTNNREAGAYFSSERALKIGRGPIWAWSVKFMLVLLRSR